MRLFLPFILALLVIAVILSVPIFVTVVYFLIAVYLVSRLWVRHSVEHVRLRRSFLDHAFLGDHVEVTIQVENASRVPVPWIEVTDSVPTELRAAAPATHVLSLGMRQRQRFSYRLDCGKRGYYVLGPFYFNTGDLLGVRQESLELPSLNSLTVYPRVLSLERLELQSLAPQAALAATSPLIEDPSRVIGVRDYQRGDSPRRMHWKATAQLSRLMVRQFDPTISRETMIFLDLDGGNYSQPYDGTEMAIVAAASIANHIVAREKLPIGLMTEAIDPLAGRQSTRVTLLPRGGRGQLIAILEVLARAGMTRDTAFAGTMRRQSVNLPWGASIVAITGDRSDELMQTLFYLRRGGFATSLILVQPSGSPREREAHPAGISIHTLSTYQDLEAV
jgi:uncharacterized protein (DUF58 family)